MRRPLAFGWCLLLWTRVVAGGDTLTIATYNIENYTAANRMTEAGYRQDYPKPESEKEALRQVIRAINADILVVQEMGTAAYLEEMRRDLKATGVDYPFAVLMEGADPDRHVALLARRTPTSVKQYAALEFSYFGAKETVKRGLLEATFATPSGAVTLFAVHLKSRFTDRPDDPLSGIRRAAEATAVRDAVLRRFPAVGEAQFLLLGDCNDSKDSKTMLHLQKRGKTTVMELLPASDSRGEVWTHAYGKEDSYSRVDHVLVSPHLRGLIVGDLARIYDGPGVREASDHRPVLVTLHFPEKTPVLGTVGATK